MNNTKKIYTRSVMSFDKIVRNSSGKIPFCYVKYSLRTNLGDEKIVEERTQNSKRSVLRYENHKLKKFANACVSHEQMLYSSISIFSYTHAV